MRLKPANVEKSLPFPTQRCVFFFHFHFLGGRLAEVLFWLSERIMLYINTQESENSEPSGAKWHALPTKQALLSLPSASAKSTPPPLFFTGRYVPSKIYILDSLFCFIHILQPTFFPPGGKPARPVATKRGKLGPIFDIAEEGRLVDGERWHVG